MHISIETDMERGRAAFSQTDYAAAEAHFREAQAGGQDNAELLHYLGYLARLRGNLSESAACYIAALQHAPADAQLHHNLGETRRSQGQLVEAAALFRAAMALAPDSALIATSLGSALLALKRPDLALPHLERAVALDPNQKRAQSERASCLCILNRYKEAVEVFRQIQRDDPAAADQARYKEALAMLALGDFENGWRLHEFRWETQLGYGLRSHLPGPYWRGEEDLTGRTIVVHREQGHGDTLQYLRYIPLLRQRSKRVILIVQPALKPLIADLPDVHTGGTLPPYDVHCSFMSLPFAFRTTLDTIPHQVPYLTVPPDRLAAWREKLGPGDGRRRIAIAWTGVSKSWGRSIPLPLLAPLFARPDCEFHVVQTTMEATDPETLRHLPHVVNHSASLADFADSAAIVAQMDLVITVDTSLAHLSGALGKPTWTMLPFGAEYRWLTQGTTSPWYPTMRLFRQPALSGWPQVIAAVNAALSA